jgi:hypothetical protein
MENKTQSELIAENILKTSYSILNDKNPQYK